MDDGDEKLPKHIPGNSSNKTTSKLVKDSLKNKTTGDRDHVPVKHERGSGNRVAVRKYREKKKAQSVYLEEEVKKLRVVNRVLIRKLHLQAALEAEAVRLRRLLMGLKAQIGDGLGVSRTRKQNNHDVSGGRH